GTGDGINWNLRGDELPGDSANARVRDPAEPGSNPNRCSAAGTWAGGDLDRRWYVGGARGVRLACATDHEVCFWKCSAGSAHVRGGPSITRRSGAGGELHSRTAGDADRSDCGVAVRLSELPSAALRIDCVGKVCFARRSAIQAARRDPSISPGLKPF